MLYNLMRIGIIIQTTVFMRIADIQVALVIVGATVIGNNSVIRNAICALSIASI